ncbi:MAG: tetrathionate reductase family octaheme c-type cytochrome [Sulfurisoma sp.]|nr:tetrathionate reductase family octaheme c-type cytochrome [Sulfurisoma sp.]
MRITHTLLAVLAALSLAAGASEPPAAAAPAAAAAAAAAAPKALSSTADHSKFKELQQSFKSGPEVTKACLSCHTEAARQIHKTKHWTWEFVNPENKQKLGKKHVVNNFCTATPSNEKFCASCHVGYGMENAKTFDYTSETNVDCLVCHDTTGAYKKLPGLAGHPTYKDIEFPAKSGKIAKAVDLPKVAQNVGKTSRATCGACHFYGGGGDAVKHGDLDSSLKMPAKYLDVHMDAKGLNFSCATCHATQGHNIPGSRYTPTGKAEDTAHMRGKENKGNPATCQSCHGAAPHKAKERLNTHTDKIACQTCHVPQYARGNNPTKMSWDWSTAGKLGPEGKRMTIKDASGHHDKYDSNKGNFTYEGDVVPEYAWLNGKVRYTLLGDPVNTQGVTRINEYYGSASDGQSRIWPLKVFRGKQPYDLDTKSLLVPHTAVGYGEKDDSGYWANYKWDAALKAGAAAAGQPFSGKFDFVATEMSWPITHMVAPKADALTCTQCHAKDGRLHAIKGVYIPRRDANGMLDLVGWLLAAATLLGVGIHGGLRVYLGRKG